VKWQQETKYILVLLEKASRCVAVSILKSCYCQRFTEVVTAVTTVTYIILNICVTCATTVTVKGRWKTGISIFTHYNNLCRPINVSKVLLVYVSPKEIGKERAQFLQDEIQKTVSKEIITKCTVFGATLPDTSFHASIKKNTGFSSYYQ